MEVWTCAKCKTGLCGCGLRVGRLEIRQGVLCATDDKGRFYLRAPRRADVALAQRVVAAVSNAGDERLAALVEDIEGIREK